MANTASLLKDFAQEKRENSPFLTLKNGESIKVTAVRSITSMLKESFGAEKQIIRMVVDCDYPTGTKQKQFDQSSSKWCEELIRTNVDVGSSFTITRDGDGTKTRYIISDVVNKAPVAPTLSKAEAAAAQTSIGQAPAQVKVNLN